MGPCAFDHMKWGYDDYFNQQGGARRGFYEGNPFSQRGYGLAPYVQIGHGFGDAAGVFLKRILVPLLLDGGKVLKKEALKTGIRVMSDMVEGKNLKTAVINEATHQVRRVAKRAKTAAASQSPQEGEGRKRKKRKRSVSVVKKRSVSSKRTSLVGKSVPLSTVQKRQRVDSLGFY